MQEEAPDLEDRFFALSIDMLCIAHFNGYFKRLNPAWEKTLGFSSEELKSTAMFEFVHPEDRERSLDQNRRVRSGGQALAFENRYRCKDGSYKWLLWNATADLKHQLIYSVAHDITERKKAEHDREQLLVELQAALAEVRELQKILPICMYCRNVRDDENYWQTVEAYITIRTAGSATASAQPVTQLSSNRSFPSQKPSEKAGRRHGATAATHRSSSSQVRRAAHAGQGRRDVRNGSPWRFGLLRRKVSTRPHRRSSGIITEAA
jgi:PAS domain S-box-containing protein